MNRYNYKMNLSYDGTRYSGWQKNKNADVTIQGKITDILTKYFNEPIELTAAGRTDKGVHALCMTVNFFLSERIDCQMACRELNGYLPADIAVLSIEEADPRFHSRYQAKGKTYRYIFFKEYDGIKPVFDRAFKSPLFEPADIVRMKQAAALLTGTHDFKGFSSDPTKKSTVRTIEQITITETKDDLVFEFTGDGFLYNMVRILVGTLIEIGQEKRTLLDIDKVFSTNDRTFAGGLAEAKGLTLVKVFY